MIMIDRDTYNAARNKLDRLRLSHITCWAIINCEVVHVDVVYYSSTMDHAAGTGWFGVYYLAVSPTKSPRLLTSYAYGNSVIFMKGSDVFNVFFNTEEAAKAQLILAKLSN